MLKIIIDNREIEVKAGTKVIEAAERLGIMIPRFCYHPALGSVGACRMCAVAFTDGPVQGVQMSCMVNAQDGMVVSTTDAEAVDFRRHVIEWLMLNHPHDCPVCDEGGHCLLQDMTVSGGHGLRRYKGEKRTHVDQDLGPFIRHEMNRCIQCYRCARYYKEFSGFKDLGVMGIGSRVYFGRSQPGTLESPFAGNLIDLCPTGVFTDKPSRFFGRRWDFQRASSLCLHCSLGCNLVASARYRQVVRHEAAYNPQVNGYFLCDRGRFGYAYANAEDRPRQALVGGREQPLSEALVAARQALNDSLDRHGVDAAAVIGSVGSNLETLAVMHQLCDDRRWLGPVFENEPRKAQNLATAAHCLESELAVAMAAVSAAETVLVVGADPVNEAPMLSLSLRQAWRQGGQVVVIDPRPVKLPFEFEHIAAAPVDLIPCLERLIGTCAADRKVPIFPEQSPTDPAGRTQIAERMQRLAERLDRSRRVVVVCGTDITTASEIALAADLVKALRQSGIEAKLFYSLSGPNALAAGLMTTSAASIQDVLDRIENGSLKILIVVENDLWSSGPDRDRLNTALDQLDLFILLGHLASPLCERADHFIPTQTLYESGGHWVNQEGRLQAAQAVMAAGQPIEITGGRDHPPRVFDHHVPGGRALAAWRALLMLTASSRAPAEGDVDDRLAMAMQSVYPILGLAEGLKPNRRVERPERGGPAPWTDQKRPDTPGSDASQGIEVLLVDLIFGTEVLSAYNPAVMELAGPPLATVHPDLAAGLGLDGQNRLIIDAGRAALTIRVGVDARMAPGVMVIPRHTALNWQVLGATRLTLDAGRMRVAPPPDDSGGDV